jgi:hypothetical protein
VSEAPKPRHWFAPGVNSLRGIFVAAWAYANDLAIGHAVELIVRPVKSRRSIIANAKMWAMLADIARQVEWPVNGVMTRLDAEDWKALITAAAKNEIRMAQGINGGVVMLGVSTRKMTVEEMSNVIEQLYAFGAERGVVWSERAKQEIPESWEE